MHTIRSPLECNPAHRMHLSHRIKTLQHLETSRLSFTGPTRISPPFPLPATCHTIVTRGASAQWVSCGGERERKPSQLSPALEKLWESRETERERTKRGRGTRTRTASFRLAVRPPPLVFYLGLFKVNMWQSTDNSVVKRWTDSLVPLRAKRAADAVQRQGRKLNVFFLMHLSGFT